MITSTASSQVKHVKALLAKAKARKEYKEYVVEGIRMVSEIPSDALLKVYLSESFSKGKDGSQMLRRFGDRAETVSDNVFACMSDTKTPQGIMATVKMHNYTFEDILPVGERLACDGKSQGAPFIICAENLQDPGNLGTIIRMSEAAGADGIIVNADSADVYNPKTVRATMGSVFRVPAVIVQDMPNALDRLKMSGVKVYAAHLDGTCEYTDADYTAGTAFVIGNEGNGLTRESAERADCLVKIPMSGRVESLNAAIACTVLSFEAARQRRLVASISPQV